MENYKQAVIPVFTTKYGILKVVPKQAFVFSTIVLEPAAREYATLILTFDIVLGGSVLDKKSFIRCLDVVQSAILNF